ncbi:hypothetical protein EMPG_10334 [Blastomyces silverae]|uniref:Uncharacterized protein n=1 Tax=Blastomyces silverae TaxID=2060906 RepID=A0A0H1B596_9EURO|nr:hypothetical protein EMPG_10334 [Blastomyces silverae]
MVHLPPAPKLPGPHFLPASITIAADDCIHSHILQEYTHSFPIIIRSCCQTTRCFPVNSAIVTVIRYGIVTRASSLLTPTPAPSPTSSSRPIFLTSNSSYNNNNNRNALTLVC